MDNNLVALLVVGAIVLVASFVVARKDGTLNPQAEGDAKKNFLRGFGVALGLWLAVLIARLVSLQWIIDNGHWIAAVLLFVCIFVVAVANARRVQKEESEDNPAMVRRPRCRSPWRRSASLARRRPRRLAVRLDCPPDAAGRRGDDSAVEVHRLIRLFWVEASVFLLFMAFWTVQTFELESRQVVILRPPQSPR